jgi:putative ABC transport system substrate-binding protein
MTIRLALASLWGLALVTWPTAVEAQPARPYRVGVVIQGGGACATAVDRLRAGVRALRPGEVDTRFYVADAMVASRTEWLIESALSKRLPTMFQERWSVVNGALAAHGESYDTIGRLSAKIVQRILLGANPGDLLVEQAGRFHFVVNRKTAKAVGVAIPQSVRARADALIE